MKRPSAEDLNMAAEWLRVNEGEDGESTSCGIVADWLEQQALDVHVRAECRRLGVPVKRLRAMLNKEKPTQSQTEGGAS